MLINQINDKKHNTCVKINNPLNLVDKERGFGGIKNLGEG